MLSKMHLGIEILDEKKPKQNKPQKKKTTWSLGPIG
jgi:hypothetical protein